MTSIMWFRSDLRLQDNPALVEACGNGEVVPLFILSLEEEGRWSPGSASQWWLHHSLEALDVSLQKKGSRLILRSGNALDAIQDVINETGAEAVCWNRRYEPAIMKRDAKVKEALKASGVEVKSFNGSLLFEPWEVSNKQGDPYKVFTPFWKACLQWDEPAEPLRVPSKLDAPDAWPTSLELGALRLLPEIDWAGGIRDTWTPGEKGAGQQLKHFIEEGLTRYITGRDRPDQEFTSRLSPYLHFGEISPRMIWHGIQTASSVQRVKGTMKSSESYLREVGWREFAHHLLYHFPDTTTKPLRKEFEKFPWSKNRKILRAWQKGQTGYPIVDAGMRELWKTGWMHNRVRMIVASFLVKDLLIPWQDGARWFWDTLVDADLANNTLGWQWTAGCGADAAPYFRIFNPILQGVKFDPEGDYVRKYVPELQDMPAKWIHKPWEAPDDVLKKASVVLGDTYPKPIVDHGDARDRALEAYDEIKQTA